MQLGGQKWLNDLAHEVARETCCCSAGVSRKGEERPPAPAAPRAPQVAQVQGQQGWQGRQGWPLLLRTSSRAGVLVQHGEEGILLTEVWPCSWTSRENKH